MSKWFGSIAMVVATGLLALPAAAGAPGGADAAANEIFYLKHVCENDATTQCVATGFGGLTGEECTGTTTCVPAFVPNAEIRALLTLIAHDETPNDTNDISVDVTLLFEFKVGDNTYVIADHYRAGDKIIDWFLFPDEDRIYNIDLGGGSILRADLQEVNDRLVQIAQNEFGIATPVIAVVQEGLTSSTSTPIRRAPRKSPELEADESAQGNGLATIARYRVTILFGEAN